MRCIPFSADSALAIRANVLPVLVFVGVCVCASGAGAAASGAAPPEALEAAVSPPLADGYGFVVQQITAGVRLTWEAQVGAEYGIWWSPSLDPPMWQEVGNLLGRAYGPVSFFDAGRADPRGFYRIEKKSQMILVPGSDGGGVDHDFYIGKYELTTAEFAAFFADPAVYWLRWTAEEQKIAHLQEKGIGETLVAITPCEDRPIQSVSWEAVVAFCNWLSRREGLQEVYDEAAGWDANITRNGYRLPTSEEWYKAACWDPTKDRVGALWNYACRSDELRPSLANYVASKDPFDYSQNDIRTTPVGFYNGSTYRLYHATGSVPDLLFRTEDAKNYYGCYDMEGNVAEFVMEESDGKFQPARMGSTWRCSYPDFWLDFPLWEPRAVLRITDRGPGGGFRLARTAR